MDPKKRTPGIKPFPPVKVKKSPGAVVAKKSAPKPKKK